MYMGLANLFETYRRKMPLGIQNHYGPTPSAKRSLDWLAKLNTYKARGMWGGTLDVFLDRKHTRSSLQKAI